MELRRAAVLGGGPGGLYAARLLKLARPSCDVVVYEQGEPGSTFGFGVGLAAGTDRHVLDRSPVTGAGPGRAGIRGAGDRGYAWRRPARRPSTLTPGPG